MKIDDVYKNPLDVVKFFQDGLDEEWFLFLLDSTSEFYNKHGVSPIIEQNKFKAFGVDYYFMVETIIDFVKSKIDEDLHERLELRIRRDFVDGESDGGLKKNADFLIAVLKYFGYLVPAKYKTYFYNQIAYFNEYKTLGFIHCGVLINGHKLKEKEWENYARLLDRIGDKSKYIFAGMGSVNFSSFMLELAEKNIKLLSWKKS